MKLQVVKQMIIWLIICFCDTISKVIVCNRVIYKGDFDDRDICYKEKEELENQNETIDFYKQKI